MVGISRVRPIDSPSLRVNRSSTIRSNVTWDLPVIITKPKVSVNERWYEHWLRQIGTILGLFARPVIMAIAIMTFYFGNNYILVIVPMLSLLSALFVLIAFRVKTRKFFVLVMSFEVATAVGTFVLGLLLLIEELSFHYTEYSNLLPDLLVRDILPLAIILMSYSSFQLTLFYPLVRGYQKVPLLPDFKSSRPIYYRVHKYLIIVIIISLLILFSILTSRLAALKNCGKPCPFGDSFFMNPSAKRPTD
ncbi:hypothetical protein M3Y94_00866300 [Aphelenchoides besseyi]|nr:hypothetical protein M3Y94_00866300 [Aphelenchoides besseyi]KAI6226693.1 hypothetical protein M3Y95_00647600 [Aphelenchoides besseyi]